MTERQEPKSVPATIYLVDGPTIEIPEAVGWAADPDFYQVSTAQDGHVVVPTRQVMYLTFGVGGEGGSEPLGIQAVRQLDEIANSLAGDPEAAHGAADDIVLGLVSNDHPDVAAAYERVRSACPWWACA